VLHQAMTSSAIAARLARSRQLCQCRVQAERKTLLEAKHHRAAANVVVLRNRLIALTGEGV